MYTVYGDSFTNTDLANGNKFVQVDMNGNYLLRAVRTSLIFRYCSTVTLTNLQMKIYTDVASAKGALLYTSTNSYTLAQILSTTSGVREIYFTFDDVPLNATLIYNFTLTGTATNLESYIGDDLQLLAWAKSYPYPQHRGGFSLSDSVLPKYPYELCLIGAEF